MGYGNLIIENLSNSPPNLLKKIRLLLMRFKFIKAIRGGEGQLGVDRKKDTFNIMEKNTKEGPGGTIHRKDRIGGK